MNENPFHQIKPILKKEANPNPKELAKINVNPEIHEQMNNELKKIIETFYGILPEFIDQAKKIHTDTLKYEESLKEYKECVNNDPINCVKPSMNIIFP